ncbi:MAG: alpha/beta fold hydrolase [Candidatus Dormibacteraceae bacterium]
MSVATMGTEDGLAYEDGVLVLEDGRELAWRWWGDRGAKPVLRLQGTPASRLSRNHDPSIQRGLGVRYLMADRPGYGGSSRKPGRGLADITDDLVALLDDFGLDRVPVMGTSGGGPHALAIGARHPDRISAVTVVVGAAPLVAEEIDQLVGVNAEGHSAAERGWQALYAYLAPVRKRLLSQEGMQGVLHDAPLADRAIMANAAWQRISRETLAESLRQGAEGWADESLVFNKDWDFDPADIKASVTWWHSADDKNAPLSAARRVASRIPKVDLHVWNGEGHFASLTHDREIVKELLDRSSG